MESTTNLGPYLILKVIHQNMIISRGTILYTERFMEKHFHDLSTERILGEAIVREIVHNKTTAKHCAEWINVISTTLKLPNHCCALSDKKNPPRCKEGFGALKNECHGPGITYGHVLFPTIKRTQNANDIHICHWLRKQFDAPSCWTLACGCSFRSHLNYPKDDPKGLCKLLNLKIISFKQNNYTTVDGRNPAPPNMYETL